MAAKSLTETHLGLKPAAAALTNDELLNATARANHHRTSGRKMHRAGTPTEEFVKWKTLADEIKRRDIERELIRIHDRPRYEAEIVLRDWRNPRPMYV